MKNLLPLILVTLVAAVGCFGKKSTPSSGAGLSPISDPILGPVQAGRRAAQRLVTENEMRNLYITMDAGSTDNGKLPPKDFIMKALQKEDRKTFQAIEEGLIVLTGIQTREGIWAYEKDAPTNGGFVISQSGVERLNPDQVKQRLKQ